MKIVKLRVLKFNKKIRNLFFKKNKNNPKLNFSNNLYFYKRYFFINDKLINIINLHNFEDSNDYKYFSNYLTWENNEIFYFYSRSVEEKFNYNNSYFKSDIIVLDFNFIVVKIYKDVNGYSNITLPANNKFVFICKSNFVSFHDIKINDKINFYKFKF